jgi:hypothetical protein
MAHLISASLRSTLLAMANSAVIVVQWKLLRLIMVYPTKSTVQAAATLLSKGACVPLHHHHYHFYCIDHALPLLETDPKRCLQTLACF